MRVRKDVIKNYFKGLDIESLARWVCFVEGVEYIWEKIDNEKLDENLLFDDIRNFNRLERAILKYISERYLTVKHDIEKGWK